MKNFPKHIFFGLVLSTMTLQIGIAQENLDFDFEHKVNRIYEPLAIDKETMLEAKTLEDINRYYKSSWVSEYISVEISTTNNGELRTAISKDDQLTKEQFDNMNSADPTSRISVSIKYIPENNLSKNDPKENNFSFIVNPAKSAQYIGGETPLRKYLQQNAVNRVSKSNFKQYQLTVVKFSIDEDGAVVDAHVFESSGDEATDSILLQSICDMPNWEPAQYANGLKVKQEFALTMGDHTSCVINLININREL